MTTTATMVKERPILFSDAMVKEIAAGRKVQTRRIMKPQPELNANGTFYEWGGAGWSKSINHITPVEGHTLSTRCPYGVPGDELWVRECWGKTRQCDDINSPEGDVIGYRATNTYHVWHEVAGKPGLRRFGNGEGPLMQANHWCDPPRPWKPSIHMPRWASRIQLLVQGIRVERVQSISSFDALWEGFEDHVNGHKQAFAKKWREINGEHSWDENPWVWVIDFSLL